MPVRFPTLRRLSPLPLLLAVAIAAAQPAPPPGGRPPPGTHPPPGHPPPPEARPFPPPPPPPPPAAVAAAAPETAAPTAIAAPTPSESDRLALALADTRASGDDARVGAALVALAGAYRRESQPALALPLLEEAMQIANRLPDYRLGREAALAAADASDALSDPGMARTWREQATAYRERIAAGFALPEAAQAPGTTAAAPAPAVAQAGPVAAAPPPPPPAPAGLPRWVFLLLPLSALLAWAWWRSHARATALRDRTERMDRNQRRLRSANAALQEEAEDLRQAVVSDALTGCLTRKAFSRELANDLGHARHYGKAVALMVFDLDHFKQINDRHGHLAGDAALKLVSGVVRECLRSEDHFGRFGGDEFLIGCYDLDRISCLALAEKIRVTVRTRARQQDPATLSELSLSIGIAMAGGDGGYDMEQLFSRADAALYLAKRSGRNRSMLDGADTPALPRELHAPRSLTPP